MLTHVQAQVIENRKVEIKKILPFSAPLTIIILKSNNNNRNTFKIAPIPLKNFVNQ